MAKKVILKAIKKWDGWILKIFQHYFDEIEDLKNEPSNKIESNLNNDKINNKNDENNLQLQNLIKKSKKKRSKRIKRIKSAIEPLKSKKSK